MQSQTIVHIKTKDGLTLPGILFTAPNSKKAIIHLHGNGGSSIFYSYPHKQDFIDTFLDSGVSVLMFNNRGAQIIKSFSIEKSEEKVERKRYGMAYEKIKECVYDIDAAISYLEEKEYKEFYLTGHSTGANKICVYDHYRKNNKISKYILLAGGDDTGLYYYSFGKEKFTRLLRESRQKIKQSKGEDIICELLPSDIFSYQGFFDIANPDGDYNTFPFLEAMNKAKLSTKPLFRYYKSIKKPTLVIYGDKDEYQYGDVPKVLGILKSQKPDFSYHLIKDADHGFEGKQKELAVIISKWLK